MSDPAQALKAIAGQEMGRKKEHLAMAIGNRYEWERFNREAFTKFIDGQYAGEYEEKLIAEFDTYLPDTPPWKE